MDVDCCSIRLSYSHRNGWADLNRQPTVPITHNLRPAKSGCELQWKSCSQRANRNGIRFGGEHFHWRKTAPAGEDKGDRDQNGRHDKIWPRVECPLSGPGQSHFSHKWQQVWNWPLLAIRTARASQIRQKMQMKTQQDQNRGFGSLLCENRGDYSDDEREAQVVSKNR